MQPVPVRVWVGREPSFGAEAAAVGPGAVQMGQVVRLVPMRMWQGCGPVPALMLPAQG
jgi:hypothetical protein